MILSARIMPAEGLGRVSPPKASTMGVMRIAYGVLLIAYRSNNNIKNQKLNSKNEEALRLRSIRPEFMAEGRPGKVGAKRFGFPFSRE